LNRCPSCGLTVRVPMSQGSHGCPDPWHERCPSCNQTVDDAYLGVCPDPWHIERVRR
jgi:hypothetical protein